MYHTQYSTRTKGTKIKSKMWHEAFYPILRIYFTIVHYHPMKTEIIKADVTLTKTYFSFDRRYRIYVFHSIHNTHTKKNRWISTGWTLHKIGYSNQWYCTLHLTNDFTFQKSYCISFVAVCVNYTILLLYVRCTSPPTCSNLCSYARKFK